MKGLRLISNFKYTQRISQHRSFHPSSTMQCRTAYSPEIKHPYIKLMHGFPVSVHALSTSGGRYFSNEYSFYERSLRVYFSHPHPCSARPHRVNYLSGYFGGGAGFLSWQEARLRSNIKSSLSLSLSTTGDRSKPSSLRPYFSSTLQLRTQGIVGSLGRQQRF